MADINPVNAIIKDGKVENADTKKASKDMNTANGYDKDSFLKILVAQMKYQDPMEPTSNTEYISQYATFTQVEQLNNMANSMNLSRASELVGKTVTIEQTNADTGKTTEVEGVVDFVSYSGNKAYVNINGVAYNIDDVKQVFNPDYTNALEVVKDFQDAIDKLPELGLISLGEHAGTIDSMNAFYNDTMDEKAKNMMNKDYVTALTQYVQRVKELREALGEYTDRIDKLPDDLAKINLSDHEKEIDYLYKFYMNLDGESQALVTDAQREKLINSANAIDDIKGVKHRSLIFKD